MRLILLFVTVVLISACDSKPAVSPTPALNYPFTLISRSNSEGNGITSIDMKIKVNPALSRDDLYLTLLTALEAQQKSRQNVDLYTVRAFAENDSQLKTVLCAVYQSTSGGKVAFEYKGETIHDDRYASKFTSKEKPKPELSPEERERQQEVGKFAGELIEAGKKIQNR